MIAKERAKAAPVPEAQGAEHQPGQDAGRGGHQRVVRVKEVVDELERLRHRAVIFEALSGTVRRMFSPLDGTQPRYLIGQAFGGASPAAPEVVGAVAADLQELALRARARYAETAAAVVSGLSDPQQPTPPPAPGPVRKAGPADKAVPNPANAPKRQPPPPSPASSDWGGQ